MTACNELAKAKEQFIWLLCISWGIMRQLEFFQSITFPLSTWWRFFHGNWLHFPVRLRLGVVLLLRCLLKKSGTCPSISVSSLRLCSFWTFWWWWRRRQEVYGTTNTDCCFVMIIVDDFSKDECPFPLFPCSKDDQFRWTYATRSHKQTQKTREKVQVISRSQLLQTDRWFCQSDKNQFFLPSEFQNPFRIWQFF